jgi:hypothetical protein
LRDSKRKDKIQTSKANNIYFMLLAFLFVKRER